MLYLLGDASDSDIELPQQAVNALIQRTTESSSDSESHTPLNPNTLFANSLLQQFVAQTQMLNAPVGALSQTSESNTFAAAASEHKLTSEDTVKRRRGRPRKINKTFKNNERVKTEPILNIEYVGDPNVSPDSGIQNSPDHASSPNCSPVPNKTKSKKEQNTVKSSSINKTNSVKLNEKHNTSKQIVSSNRLDRMLYSTTDRILYPPRRKVGRPPGHRRGPGRPSRQKLSQSVLKKTAVVINNNSNDKQSTEKNVVEKKTFKTVKHSLKCNRSKMNRSKKFNKNLKQKKDVTSSHVNNKRDEHKSCSSDKKKSTLLYEICERVSKRLELNKKSNQKVHSDDVHKVKRNKVLSSSINMANKNKTERLKGKYTTLKNAKLMHSKHKHKKHKKCKIKILKPVSTVEPDPKIISEIEKLVTDFMELCKISTNKQLKEANLESKGLKKNAKKRKSSEVSERKKKKVNAVHLDRKEANSNEQRLPLKKRHYHLSTNSDIKVLEVQMQTNIESEKLEKKVKDVKVIPGSSKVNDKLKTAVPNKNISSSNISNESENSNVVSKVEIYAEKVSNINNNEYNLKNSSVKEHIDEAIEACISKYSSLFLEKNKEIEANTEATLQKDVTSDTITTTTPKKRHRLENPIKLTSSTNDVKQISTFNSINEESSKVKPKHMLETAVKELKLKRSLSLKPLDQNSKKNDVNQTVLKKKPKEDINTNGSSKVISSQNTDSTQNKRKKDDDISTRASVIKYPPNKKSKSVETEKIDSISETKPTGIFTPTVDLELHLSNETKKEDADDLKGNKSNEVNEDISKNENNESTIKVNDIKISPKKRTRKRRPINRTGFPTVKKKKKKITETLHVEVNNENKQESCDRVPRDGEEYLMFVKRTEIPNEISPMDQKEPSYESLSPDVVSKWEVLSECDSLPQEDRIDFENLDIKDENYDIFDERVSSPATSIETKSSNKSKRENYSDDKEDLDEVSLEMRIKRIKLLKNNLINNSYSKNERILRKRCTKNLENKAYLRDSSPASSIEPERKLREDVLSGDDKKIRKSTRWRKRYLVAGLFSDYYKENE